MSNIASALFSVESWQAGIACDFCPEDLSIEIIQYVMTKVPGRLPMECEL